MKTIILMLILSLQILAEVDNGSVTHSGEGTYYNDRELPNCSFPLDERPVYHGAMNKTEYDDSKVCGSYVTVKGPKGEITVLIDNQCPECKEGDIDLSEEAFVQIANKVDGRVDITWQYVEGASSSIKYQFKDGSNRWHLEILTKNIKYAIKTLEVEIDDNWVLLARTDYNYFVYSGDIGSSSVVKLRATDINGQQIVDEIDIAKDMSINLPTIVTVEGIMQFPSLDSTTTIVGDDFSELDIMSIGGNSIKVAPSPVFDKANVIFTIRNKGIVSLTIYNSHNRELEQLSDEFKAGENYVIDEWGIFEKLSKGIYYLELKVDDRRVAFTRFYKI